MARKGIRTKMLHFWVSAEEAETFRAAAEREKRSLSDFLRLAAAARAARKQVDPSGD